LGLQIFNTQSQKKEEFVPLTPGKVRMYVCGPTVYDYLHIGNFRGAIFFNLVRNWLESHGYQVTFVYNYTDVDDKIIKRANADGVDSSVIVEKYIAEFEKDFAALKLRRHDYNPRVTDHMNEIITMVEELVQRDMAYNAQGEVLYSVRKFAGYGKLSNKNVDDLQAGSRVEIDKKKRDPLDFALWKPAKPGEPKWSSPWGEGRPGWHIECSAMARKLLGDSIDIHGGGMDLIFPHHENEIAQSEGASGRPFVKYWMHNNMLTFGDKKMSKSLGNILTGRAFLTRYNAEILKFMMLQAHYRSLIDFSEAQIANAIAGLARIYSALALAQSVIEAADGLNLEPKKAAASLTAAIEKAEKEYKSALDDDFNTPEALAAIYTLVRTLNGLLKHGQKPTAEAVATAREFVAAVAGFGGLMSLFQEPAHEYLGLLDDMLLEHKQLKREEIDQLVLERTQARVNKDFARADEVRKKLTEMGIALHDTPAGTHWEVQK